MKLLFKSIIFLLSTGLYSNITIRDSNPASNRAPINVDKPIKKYDFDVLKGKILDVNNNGIDSKGLIICLGESKPVGWALIDPKLADIYVDPAINKQCNLYEIVPSHDPIPLAPGPIIDFQRSSQK